MWYVSCRNTRPVCSFVRRRTDIPSLPKIPNVVTGLTNGILRRNVRTSVQKLEQNIVLRFRQNRRSERPYVCAFIILTIIFD